MKRPAQVRPWAATAISAAVLLAVSLQPALAFCVRNDTGAPIRIEAVDGTAAFAVELANNEKSCCRPEGGNCAIDQSKIKLSISATEGDANCAVTVDAKGNVNVTGDHDLMKCKANKAGSTMDWASG